MKKIILLCIFTLILITQVFCGEESVFDSNFSFTEQILTLAILVFFLFWWRGKSNKMSLEKYFWNKLLLEDFIIKFLWEDIVKGAFRGVASGLPTSVSKTMNIIIPTLALGFLGFYSEESIVDTAVEYREDYIKKAFESSLDIKIIGPLTKIPFRGQILYDLLKTDYKQRKNKKDPVRESRIDSEYKHLEKSFNEWQDNFDENLDFIQGNVSKDKIKKRICLRKNKKMSESECKFWEINNSLLDDQGFFKKLKTCYDRYKKNKNDSCFKTTEYTLSKFDNQIKSFDKKTIEFYRKFTEERKK